VSATFAHGQGRLRRIGLLACTTTAIASGAGAVAPAGTGAQTEATPQPTQLRLAVRHHVLAGRGAPVRGALTSGEAGRSIRIQVRRGGGWRTVDRTRSGEGGRFRGKFRTGSPGRYKVRARVLGSPAAARRARGKVHVYRKAPASWYGPGFYGRRTACGRTMSGSIKGVAHKSLPCGTKVTLRYRGRTATVPVIDRGPYVGNRVYDLTVATKRKLRFGSTGNVLATR
jgi:rare lipoprotein A